MMQSTKHSLAYSLIWVSNFIHSMDFLLEEVSLSETVKQSQKNWIHKTKGLKVTGKRTKSINEYKSCVRFEVLLAVSFKIMVF
jgi:leucyl-tRNA synthetase